MAATFCSLIRTCILGRCIPSPGGGGGGGQKAEQRALTRGKIMDKKAEVKMQEGRKDFPMYLQPDG